MGNVLERGEGQKKDGLYYYKWIDGLGKARYVYAASLSGLREKEREISIGVLANIRHDMSSMTLNDALEYWIASREADIAVP